MLEGYIHPDFSDVAVITSYSIHYTKLYDPAVHHHLSAVVDADGGPSRPTATTRARDLSPQHAGDVGEVRMDVSLEHE